MFNEFLSAPAGIAAQAMLGLAFLDFIMGCLAAFRNGIFDFTVVAAFLRKHVQGRVLPIAILLVGAHVTGQATLSAAAIAAAGIYTTETLASLAASIGQSMDSENAEVDTVPEE